MSRPLAGLCWPAARLGEAMGEVARAGGIAPRVSEAPTLPAAADDDAALDLWVESTAAWLGLDAESVQTSYADSELFIRRAGPALLRVPGEQDGDFLALVRGNRKRAWVVAPDLSLRTVPVQVVRRSLCAQLEKEVGPQVDRILALSRVPQRRRASARHAIIEERLGQYHLATGWLLRLPPETSFWRKARRAGLFRHLIWLTIAHTVSYLLWVGSWWLLGRGVLQGRLDTGWLSAWALILLTLVPFRMLSTWLQGRFAIDGGAVLKRHLLAGALRLHPDEVRHQGAGHLLGRVLESEAVESLALGGGFQSLVAIGELCGALAVLSFGAGGGLHAALLLGWTLFTGALAARQYVQLRRWTRSRLDMTHGLVERMVGHRTRLAQQAPEHWHDGDDATLDRYQHDSINLDKTAALLAALVPRGWVVLGLLGLLPALAVGQASETDLAVAVGGFILAWRALDALVSGLEDLAGAVIAAEAIGSIFRAASVPRATASPTVSLLAQTTRHDTQLGKPLLQARDVTFRYREKGPAVLRGVGVVLNSGDRVLLEGPSGGGKSTFANVVTGIRAPESGLLLLRGLDRMTLGDAGWGRIVAAAPQFHENHVLTESFAFNLLMGKQWPPEPADFEEAEQICDELGLADLLQRMPSGLMQMVGESGWQLSHGERSRLYIARALVQDPDLLVLDESFAALDPENLKRCLSCVLRRARSLLVIAHP